MWSLYRTPWDLERLYAPANVVPKPNQVIQTLNSARLLPNSAAEQALQTAHSLFKQG